VGYHLAGFDVVGVDLVRKHDYPFEFHLANALTFPLDGFDAVTASPPCQLFTGSTALNPATAGQLFDPHSDLVGLTRDRLILAGVPYVIENVPGAPLIDPIRLCGSSFGLEVVRHRCFELGGWTLGDGPPACRGCNGMVRDGRAISVFGHGGGRMDGRRGMRGRFEGMTVLASFQRAMGIDWMTDVQGLAEAIPPAYTEWIGRRLFGHLVLRSETWQPAGLSGPAGKMN
jgi:DNA (cytosine-5)-methyltransferase 1